MKEVGFIVFKKGSLVSDKVGNILELLAIGKDIKTKLKFFIYFNFNSNKLNLFLIDDVINDSSEFKVIDSITNNKVDKNNIKEYREISRSISNNEAIIGIAEDKSTKKGSFLVYRDINKQENIFNLKVFNLSMLKQ